jgi:excisionase family DNA binding protein
MDKHERPIAVLFLTYKEAAAACRLSQSMIRKMARDGRIKVARFGRAARIPVSELTRIGIDAR